MTREPNHWFRRTFDHGNKKPTLTTAAGPEKSPPQDSPLRPAAVVSDLDLARLVARAEALTEATLEARTFEKVAANAGIVRLRLDHLKDEAWDRVEAHRHSPLMAAGSSGVEPAAVSGTARRVPGLDIGAEPSVVPLLETRLRFVAESLEGAIDVLSQPKSDGVDRALAEFLSTIREVAAGERTPLVVPPEPRSIRVGPPAPSLRVVE